MRNLHLPEVWTLVWNDGTCLVPPVDEGDGILFLTEEDAVKQAAYQTELYGGEDMVAKAVRIFVDPIDME